MIAVADVEASSAWYQALLGVRSDHGGPDFDRLVDEAGRVVLLLHHWGGQEHPSMQSAAAGPPGHGLQIYFRVPDVKPVFAQAQRMGAAAAAPPAYDELAHQTQFHLRDPDGYIVTICE